MMMKYVAVPLAPFVMTNGGSNALNEPVIESMTLREMIVLMLGKMMCVNCWNLLAPSMSAASYNSGSTDMIAPMKSTMFCPQYRQIDVPTRETLLSPCVRSQYGIDSRGMPSQPSTVSSTNPCVKKNLNMNPIAIPFIR